MTQTQAALVYIGSTKLMNLSERIYSVNAYLSGLALHKNGIERSKVNNTGLHECMNALPNERRLQSNENNKKHFSQRAS